MSTISTSSLRETQRVLHMPVKAVFLSTRTVLMLVHASCCRHREREYCLWYGVYLRLIQANFVAIHLFPWHGHVTTCPANST